MPKISLEKLIQESIESVIQAKNGQSELKFQEKLKNRMEDTVPQAKEEKKSVQDNEESPVDDEEKEVKDDKEEKELPEVTLDVVVDKLNIIRSGKSLKDEEVAQQMQEFMDDLKDAEKIALYGFLKSIGQIVAAGASGEEVKEPNEEPYDIKMKRVKDLESKRKEKKRKEDLASKKLDSELSKRDILVKKPKKKSKENIAPPIKVRNREV